jgi:hypothetical protein
LVTDGLTASVPPCRAPVGDAIAAHAKCGHVVASSFTSVRPDFADGVGGAGDVIVEIDRDLIVAATDCV